MSKRLMDAMNDVVLKEGPKGKARLAIVVDRETRMIDRYRKGQSSPSPDNARRLALACGLTELDAGAIASECGLWKGQRTA